VIAVRGGPSDRESGVLDVHAASVAFVAELREA
jgi:hypothetical protein